VVGEDAKKTGTQALERAIAVLRLFADEDAPQSLTQVSRALGLNPTTTHRILATLVRERLLAHDASSERYRIGPDALLLFAAAARRYGIAAARAELDALVAATNETAALGMLDASDIVVVLQAESALALRVSRPVGTRVPAHVSAMGKAMIAFGTDPGAHVDALGKLHSFTAHSITDKPRLLEDLRLTRERGWAVNDNERYDGVRAVAVPIVRGDEPVRAAVGLQGPSERFVDSRIDELVALLQGSARRLAVVLQISSF